MTAQANNFRYARYGIVTTIIGLGLLIAMILGCMFGFKAYSRYQARADVDNKVKTSRVEANNQVELNHIKISQQEQRVKIAEQEAEVRLREAEGVKAAQDEIAKTLTREYIQYEMTKVLADIAKSGKNSSVIYVPTGSDGLPIVTNADATKR